MASFVVTGATKGIGRSLADNLIEKGHHVIGIARHDDSSFPGSLKICDLFDIEKTNELLDELIAEDDVTGLVNNVGVSLPQRLDQLDFVALQKVLHLNLIVAIQFTQKLSGHMKQRRHGRIVNVCSRAIFGARDRTAYSAAKAALVECTRTWALELAEWGITVNAVAPGPVDTELFRETRPVGSTEESAVLSTIPLGRLGTTEDIANAISFSYRKLLVM